jgi:cation transporter-like permease
MAHRAIGLLWSFNMNTGVLGFIMAVGIGLMAIAVTLVIGFKPNATLAGIVLSLPTLFSAGLGWILRDAV